MAEQQVGIAEDRHKSVVKIVSNAARHPPQGPHPFLCQQVLLERPELIQRRFKAGVALSKCCFSTLPCGNLVAQGLIRILQLPFYPHLLLELPSEPQMRVADQGYYNADYQDSYVQPLSTLVDNNVPACLTQEVQKYRMERNNQ